MFSASTKEDDAVEVMDVDPQQDQVMFQDVSYFYISSGYIHTAESVRPVHIPPGQTKKKNEYAVEGINWKSRKESTCNTFYGLTKYTSTVLVSILWYVSPWKDNNY